MRIDSTGFRESVLHGELMIGDIADPHVVSMLLERRQVEAVLHFAAHIVLPESVAQPLKYYGNNTCATRNLLECCAAAGVRHFISRPPPPSMAFPPAVAPPRTARPCRSIPTAGPSS